MEARSSEFYLMAHAHAAIPAFTQANTTHMLTQDLMKYVSARLEMIKKKKRDSLSQAVFSLLFLKSWTWLPVY